MSTPEHDLPARLDLPALRIAVAATFTAEPVQDALDLWMAELELPASVEFAPYSQVFQQLLDPNSLFAQNRRGVNILLVRPEDWRRALAGTAAGGGPASREALERNTADLIDAVRAMAARSATPLIVVLCPASPKAGAARIPREELEHAAARIADELAGLPGVSLVSRRDFDLYPVADYHDPRRDRLGHIPYTPAFFAALGTILARRIHLLLTPPHKVIVLDCDNTLWKGVVAEDGVDGIAIPPAWQGLQQFLVDLAGQGFLLCLCSKNAEADVLEVLDRRPDMILKREHLVAWRINWQPKSQNIRALARELNLGLDSFIFLDDNPVECAEVGSACPEVLSLRLPIDGDLVGFLRHVWAFDRPRVTAEDRQRTAMYRREADRARFQAQAPTIGAFLAGLGLAITIAGPTAEQIDRVAQLTQRTNQFNFTTRRRHDGEIRRLGESGLECLAVEVSDRFGDYGLVGATIFGARGDALEVDTFLLSCRVLGRGVEHRMLVELGELARSRGLSRVEATVLFTGKNQPARDFLEAVASSYRREIDGGLRYEIPAEVAARVAYRPEAVASAEGAETIEAPAAPSVGAAEAGRKSPRFERIAAELTRPEQVLEAIHARSRRRQARPAAGPPPAPPRNEIESALVGIWSDLLRIDPVGIRDHFFELGGTSLQSVDLFAQIEQRFGKAMPLTSLLEAPTIEELARLLSGESARDSLVRIREGHGRPPVFLVHDGHGETMLYRNLAQRLAPGHAVYGLQPYSLEGVPMAHTRIVEMAAYQIDKIRAVHPRGPYLLGGMCAGGVIAFEMARQLQSQGERVAMVALLDAADVAAPLITWRLASQRLQRFGGLFRDGRSDRPGRRMLTVLRKAVKKATNLGTYLAGEFLERVRDEVRLRLYRAYLDRGWRLPLRLRQISLLRLYQFAEREYRPEGLFEGKLALFRATSGNGSESDVPYIDRYEDPHLGWDRRASHGVRAFDVSGGHSSMLQEPYVEDLADQLQSYIDEVLAAVPVARRQPVPVPHRGLVTGPRGLGTNGAIAPVPGLSARSAAAVSRGATCATSIAP
jgi:FkbH-like protein